MNNALCKTKELKKTWIRLFVIYTVIMAVTGAVVFYPFLDAHASLVWNPDGMTQHYTAFVYFGNYLRDIIKNLFAGHLIIPQYDLSIGLGSDILQALHYYVIGDPLNLVSVLIPEKYAAIGYSLLIIFRYYLAGLAFCMLTRYKKLPIHSSVAGSVIYAFTAYTMSMALRHPSFLNPLIYFPLILIGIEMIFDKKRPYLFITMIFISAMSSFYFFFVISVFTVLYIFVRLFFVYKEHIIKNFFQSLVKFGGCYLLGIIMAAIVFVPIVITFLSSSRGGLEYLYDSFFEKEFYRRFLAAFAGPYGIEKTYLGFTVLGLAGVFLLLLQRKKHAFLKLSFVILTVMTMLPLCSKVINGFSYVTNRWSWVYGLLTAYIFAVAVSDLKKLSFKKSVILALGAAAFFVAVFLNASTRRDGFFVSCAVFLLFAAGCIVFSAIPYVYRNRNKDKIMFGFKGFIVAVSMFAVFCNAFYIFGRSEGNFPVSFMKFSAAKSFAVDNSEKIFNELENTQTTVARYEKRRSELSNFNNAMLSKTYGICSYLSLNNTYMNNFQEEMGLVHKNFSVINECMCDPFIQAIENIKYYTDDTEVKYSYNIDGKISVGTIANHKNSGMDKKQFIYENKNYIPFGFAYKNVISQADYDSLNAVDKRSVLLSAAVINDSDEFVTADINALDFKGVKADVSVETTDSADLNGNTVYINEDQGKVMLKVNKPANSQLYCVINNIKFHNLSNTRKSEDGTVKTVTASSDRDNNYVNAAVDGVRGLSVNVATPYYDYYSGITDYTFNLGYFEETEKQVMLTFNKGYWEFDSIDFISVPMNNYSERVNALAENTLENLKIEPNTISGTITADEMEWLFLSVPYSEYWSAYVDGEKTEIHRANTAFSAVQIEAGEHTVELRYANRSIKYSSALSAAGFIAFAGVIALWESYNKKKKCKSE